ncbi:glycoside hydrolase family 5 protein [uncultured Umboniibacter sp.]|uniref:glycoside hydrolase family 5 protein n=1 Tax=uncultured Umboniibacter sp. TaxID=1798917 RepID=UPI0026026339|nr:glycoside hydrolase family 5 protein [uncultured Umboniibacter sp.]
MFKTLTKRITALIGCTLLAMSSYASVVSEHGAISVKNGQIVDQNGDVLMLAGPSFFWSNTTWDGEKFYRADLVDYFVDDWRANAVRAAIGGDNTGSWESDSEGNWLRLTAIIDQAISRDIYVVVDFHSHYAHQKPDVAADFFNRVLDAYAEYPNIIYEIYNEPLNDVTWDDDVKPYSELMISIIREKAPSALIVVGSPSWSQDVEVAAKNPLDDPNVTYSLHFYTGTHKQALREKADVAMSLGASLFVSEWGAVSAHGDGDVNYESTEEWFRFVHEHQLSHFGWGVSDKNETAAIFEAAGENFAVEDLQLTENGRLLRQLVRETTRTSTNH